MTACAPSPLYVSSKAGGTIGEIPRDTRGEPMWSVIRQPETAPPAAVYPTDPVLPVIPPQHR